MPDHVSIIDSTPRVHRSRFLLYLLLAALALYHAWLLRKGAFAWPDEFLYAGSYNAIEKLRGGDWRAALFHINRFGARPGAETLWLIPAVVQVAVAGALHLNPWSRTILHIPTMWNVLVAILLVVAMHRLALWFFDGDESLAAATAATYALLPSSQLWIRHVVPYDIAICLSLFNLYLVVSRPMPADRPHAVRRIVIAFAAVGLMIVLYGLGYYKFAISGLVLGIVLLAVTAWGTMYILRDERLRSPLLAGWIAGFAIAVYPAYYSFPLALLLLIALRGSSWRRPPLTACALFIFGMLDVLFAFEVLCRAGMGGSSYLGNAARLSATVTQGAFEEGYVFLVKYLTMVDGAGGLAMLVMAAAFAIVVVRRRRSLSPRDLVLAQTFAIFALLYVAYGTQAVVLHKMVFSGRFVRMYIPIVVIAAFGAVRIAGPQLRQLILGGALLAAAVSFAMFVRSYAVVDYPVDVLARMQIGFEDIVPQHRIFETARIPEHDASKGRMPGTNFITHANDSRFAIVNFGFFDLEGPDFKLYVPPPRSRLVFRAVHLQCFRPSGFESYTPARRQQFAAAGPCELKIYRLAD